MEKLFYLSSAGNDWNKALPIGNGKLGAMIFGSETGEHYQLNEDSVWFGGPKNRNNQDALAHLEEVRALILDEKTQEAERLLKYAFSGTPQSQSAYQTLGDLYMDFCGCLDHPVDYKRELDLSTAIHTVKSTEESTKISYERECFASFNSNCIVTRITSSQKGRLSLAVSLQRMAFYEGTKHENDSLYMWGNCGGNGVDFCAGVRLIPVNGTVTAMGEHVIVEDCDEVVVLLSAATTFRVENPMEEVKEALDQASKLSYEQLKQEHIDEYQSYYNKLTFDLADGGELDELPTDERLNRVKDGNEDQGLLVTYFNYGRYLLISSSRGDCLPANLQGIWNNQLDPPWGSKYTININTEMNYWPALSCALPDCELPLFSMLERMKKNGEETAKEMYGCRGFVAHHNTDIWANTAPQDIYIPATYWVMGGAWLCTHVWNHYEYTMDEEFLSRMYPVVKSAVTFFLDYLIEVDGDLVTCPSVSPENTYITKDGTRGCVCAGATMDTEILRDLFTQCLKESEIIHEEDAEFIEQVKQTLSKLPELKVGKHGQLMEWQKDYDEAESGHRHISHLWGLYPSWQITPDNTPQLCDAAKVTLKRRLANGGGHTGWSRAWIINMYARLWNGDEAYKNIIMLLTKSTLDNLFDNHPPFQIDGNFGATAAMTEMILQSGDGRIVLLPALPKQWKDGSMRGIGVRGNLTADVFWKNHELDYVVISAQSNCEVPIYYKNQCVKLKLTKGEHKKINLGDF